MPVRTGPSPRYKIKALSKQLRTLTFPKSPISVNLATFAADAFDSFLAGHSPTLDAAFGIGKRRGAPGWPKARLKLAKEIHVLRIAGKSWSRVQDELERRGYKGTDLSTIKRTYKEFRLHLMSKDLWQSIEPELLQD